MLLLKNHCHSKACFNLVSHQQYMHLWKFFILLAVLVQSLADNGFTNEWAVEIEGGDEVAEQVASIHGFINHGKVSRRFAK